MIKVQQQLLALVMISIASFAAASSTPIFEIQQSPGVYLQAPLDHSVYFYSADSQLRDLLVLDGEGNELPSRIVAAPSAESQNPEPATLTFFPVPAGSDPQHWLGAGKAEVRIDDAGIAVTVNGSQPKAQGGDSPSDRLAFYLVDLRQHQSPIHKLALQWSNENPGRFLQAEISASKDLQDWIPIGQQTLVKLDRQGASLLRNEIPLAFGPHQFDYLRIRFPEDEVRLMQVLAYGPPRFEAVPPDAWKVNGQSVDEAQPVTLSGRSRSESVAAWEYQREDNAPAQALSLDLQSRPYGDSVRIFSRADQRQDWRLRHAGVWFNVKVGEEWQRSEPISLHGNSDRYWRVELSQSARDRAQPALVFQQARQMLQFIANNNPPYQLAVAARVPSSKASSQIVKQVIGEEAVRWQSVELHPLPEVRMPAAAAAELNWSGWLFWGLLSFAVLVLIAFSIRLYRQMGA